MIFIKLVPYFILLFIVSCGGGGGSSASSGSVAADSTPPTFSDFTSSVPFVSIGSSSENITLSIALLDNPSGIKLDELPTPKLKKAGSIDIEANSAWTLSSGDNKNGSYSTTVTVPTTASPGGYYLTSSYWSDIWGNSAINSTPTAGGASNNGLTVINN